MLNKPYYSFDWCDQNLWSFIILKYFCYTVISQSWGLISNIPTQDNSINSSHMETTPGPTRPLKRRDRRKSEETITVCNNTKKFLELPSDVSTTSSKFTNCLDRYVNHRQKWLKFEVFVTNKKFYAIVIHL